MDTGSMVNLVTEINEMIGQQHLIVNHKQRSIYFAFSLFDPNEFNLLP
jgi:hypothetical protein